MGATICNRAVILIKIYRFEVRAVKAAAYLKKIQQKCERLGTWRPEFDKVAERLAASRSRATRCWWSWPRCTIRRLRASASWA